MVFLLPNFTYQVILDLAFGNHLHKCLGLYEVITSIIVVTLRRRLLLEEKTRETTSGELII